MGWLGGAELDPLSPLGFDEENALIEEFSRSRVNAGGLQLLGIDRYGADLKLDGVRERFAFDGAKPNIESLHAALEVCMQRHTN
jgi:hypothetical protein